MVLPPGVEEHEIGSPAERNKNRKLLRDLAASHQETAKDYERFKAESQRRMDAMEAENRKIREDLQRALGENARLQEDLRKASMDLSQSVESSRRDAQGKLTETFTRLDRLTSQSQMAAQEGQEMKANLRQVTRECREVRRDLAEQRGDLQQTKSGQKKSYMDQQREIENLKHGATSANELTRLSATSSLAVAEVRTLRQQLFDRGLLAPQKPPPEEVQEEEHPPVGSLDLGEDVFSARLLLRLGFYKAEYQKRAAGEEGEDAQLTSGSEEERENMEEVSGIALPEVPKGSLAFYKITFGWVAVCIFTFLVQVVALGLMMRAGIDLSGGGSCFKEAPPPVKWWCLHLSKALAMVIAGVSMCKDLLNITNYWMAARLLIPHHVWEVTFTTIIRVGLRVWIVACLINIFLKLTNSTDVWLNFTALDFICCFSEDMLTVAKSGVWGHDLSQAVGGLNYSLGFTNQYPKWFAPVRNFVLIGGFTVVSYFIYVTWTSPDAICPPKDLIEVHV